MSSGAGSAVIEPVAACPRAAAGRGHERGRSGRPPADEREEFRVDDMQRAGVQSVLVEYECECAPQALLALAAEVKFVARGW